MMAVLHAFGNADSDSAWVIPGKWSIARRFALANVAVQALPEPDGKHTRIEFLGVRDFSAAALLLEKACVSVCP